MSNAARNKLGLKPEVLRNIDKHGKLPTHDIHVGQHIMYQDIASKQWHPAISTSICQQKQSFKIKLLMASSVGRLKHISSLTHLKTRWHNQWCNQWHNQTTIRLYQIATHHK